MTWFTGTTKIIIIVAVILLFLVSAFFSFRGNKFLKSLKSKLTFTVVAVALVLVGVLSIVSVRFVKNASVETLANSIMPIADSTSNYMNQSVRRLGETLDENMRSNKVTNTNTLSDFIVNVKGLYVDTVNDRFDVVISGLCGFYVYDQQGNVIESSADPTVDVASIITVDHVRDAVVSGKPVITECVKDDGGMHFGIIVKTTSPESGETIAVGAVIDGSVLAKILETTSLDDMAEFYLVDKDGNIICRPTKKDTYFKYVNPVKLAKTRSGYSDAGDAFSEITKKDDGYVTFEYSDMDLVGGYAKLSAFDVNIVMICDTAKYTKNAISALESIIFISLALLSVAMIIASLLANRISKPIISTTERIRELARGNLNDPVDVWYSNDELGVLSTSLEETVFSLRQYISLITHSLTQISEGNLQYRLEGNFKGDFFKIKSTFNEIFDSLNDTFASINLSAEQVNSGAVQVSDYSQSVSQGATQQASAIEELSATLSDVSEQVIQNSEDAKNAYNIVSENTEAVNSCNDDMENMLNAMHAIKTSSDEIAKIIKVIDEISFQTNILALNAAVEAAREGSKGFGVVADEVRRLASRSAEAAKQTAELIENSSIAVDKGSQIAGETAKSLNEIVEKSNQIRALVKNISEASETQSGAIAQVNTGVDQISAVVSANTSTAVSAASASEELSSQSLILKNMIAKFKLNNDEDRKSSGLRFTYDDEDFEDEDAPADETDQEPEPETRPSMGRYDYDDEFAPDEDDEY